jgi:Abnormal spindle-like microcephaly-assoc'd, ASPM-SPD-2-Hydin
MEQARVPAFFCPFGQALSHWLGLYNGIVMSSSHTQPNVCGGLRVQPAPVYASRGLLCLLAVALGFLSYGCVGATGGSGSNLTALPSIVSFGNVNTGSSTTRSVTVANPGISAVSVSNVSISGPGFSVSGVPVGLTLAAGQTAALTVTFAPSSAGAATGKVTVTDPSSPNPLAISLSGNGLASGAHSVTLTWNPSASSVAGYRAYRATSPGGPYTSLNSSPNPQLRWADSTVQSGTTYYYVVVSVAPDTTESTYSNQATAAVPKP